MNADTPLKEGAEAAARIRAQQSATIKLALKRNNMTQRDLARETGINESHLSRSLRGSRNFKSWEYQKIMHALGLGAEADEPEQFHPPEVIAQARQYFGERLRLRREALGWPPERVHFGVTTPERYKLLENGKQEPTIHELSQLAPKLGVSLTWLITGIPTDGDPGLS